MRVKTFIELSLIMFCLGIIAFQIRYESVPATSYWICETKYFDEKDISYYVSYQSWHSYRPEDIFHIGDFYFNFVKRGSKMIKSEVTIQNNSWMYLSDKYLSEEEINKVLTSFSDGMEVWKLGDPEDYDGDFTDGYKLHFDDITIKLVE